MGYRSARMIHTNASRHDLRTVLIHEYGHLKVAEALGGTGWIDVEPNPRRGEDGERFWCGAARTSMGMMSDDARRKIALAGQIAEWIEVGMCDGDILDEFHFGVATDFMSATDAEHAGDYSDEDVESALELVQKLWPAISESADFRLNTLSLELEAGYPARM